MARIGATRDEGVAKSRERLRGDWIVGMTARQTRVVHERVTYARVVDDTTRTVEELSREIANYIKGLSALELRLST